MFLTVSAGREADYDTCIYFFNSFQTQFFIHISNFNFFILISFLFSIFFYFAFLCLCLRVRDETNNKYANTDGVRVCLYENRSVSANAWNGCARINATRATNDAYDATISMISLWTAVCDDGGPGNNHYNNCTTSSSSNSNCTYLRYLFSTSSTDATSNH